MDVLQAGNFGWWSLIPPLVAICLALATKEVIFSLLMGILSGSLIYSNGSAIGMLKTTFTVMGERMGANVDILIFLGLLGALVVIVTRAGGSAAYGEWAARKIKTRRGASFATALLGCLIFIDDYFNCLTVGTVMSPVTDKHRISRVKLAYILDAMAAPVCIIAPVSSWGASVSSYMQDAGLSNGMSAFVKTIFYNQYALLTIVMVTVVCFTKIQFGAMGKFEKQAIETGEVFRYRHESESGVMEKRGIPTKGKVIDLILPIAVLIVVTLGFMLYRGEGYQGEGLPFGMPGSDGGFDTSFSLVLGSFVTLVFTFCLFLPRKILGFREFMGGITEGICSMVPAFTILVLAWSISGICGVDYLNTGGYVGNLVQNTSFPSCLLPVIMFGVAAFLGFATGTSWGTMALLIPIGVAVTTPLATSYLLYPVLGAILGGSVYGDHISPISDTTILSSTGAGCDHIDHVSTQIGYATLVAVCSGVGYILQGIHYNPLLEMFPELPKAFQNMGMTKNLLFSMGVSLALLCVLLYGMTKRFYRNTSINYEQVKH